MIKRSDINVANILSFSRIFFGIFFFIIFLFLYHKIQNDRNILILQISAFLIFIISIITDGLDGYYARKHNIVSNLGKHLDPLADSIFFIIVFFSFLILKLLPIYIFIIILLRECFMHLFFRPFCKKKGTTLPANIFGKIKTICQSVFSLLILFLLILKQVLILNKINIGEFNSIIYDVSYILFFIIAFLSIFSLITYIIKMKNLFISK